MEKEILIAIISSLGLVLSATVAALATVYSKIKNHIDRKTEETKHHNDISVMKLNGLLTSVIHSFDKPAWLKIAIKRADGEVEFRMSELNTRYTEIFHKSRSEYIGKTDLEAGWTKSEAEAFRRNDLLVWATGEPLTFTEIVDGKTMKFRKLRVTSLDGNMKGVFGYMITDCGEIENGKNK